MRIDYTGKTEISNTNINMDIKESNMVRTGETGVKKNTLVNDIPYGVAATSVEKALFSLESELDKRKQDAQEADTELIKRQMAVLSNVLSGQDYKKLQEEGYSLNDTDVKTIVTVMDKIKLELAKGGMDISVFGDELSMEQLEAMTGSAGQACRMAADLSDCKDGDITYLVGNELEPTIENLYLAQHSGSSRNQEQSYELPEDEGLRRQMAQVIADAGLPVNETTMEYGAMLLQHEIPLTAENLAYVDQLKSLKLPKEEAEIQTAVAVSVSEGREPAEAYLLEGWSLKDRAMKAQETVAETGEDELKAVVEQGEPLTIENLGKARNQTAAAAGEDIDEAAAGEDIDEAAAGEDIDEAAAGEDIDEATAGEDIDEAAAGEDIDEAAAGEDIDEAAVVQEEGSGEVKASEAELRLITARRQLEEIRLAMTVQANYHLLKQGISIETMDLEQLVEELKGIEKNYYKALLENQGIAASEQSVTLFQETVEKTEELKGFPVYVLGSYSAETTAVETLYEAGSRLASEWKQAGEAYDTMMTVPRRDLGDSLQKAFGNVQDILTELDLEASEVNQRAVRILAYNQMEINQDSISRIKAADEKLQNLFANLKPAVVMEMIREGIHPLSMDVATLNAKAEEIAEQLDPGQEERYSKYLWELEQKHEVTQEEKESYIGIYRLLCQIEKTDGAVIGAVVNQGGGLSMKNLLTAVRTRRTRGMDVSVDEAFGAAGSVTRKEPSISQQIDAAYQTDCAKEALKNLTPEGFQGCMEAGDWQELTPEQLLWQLKKSQEGQTYQMPGEPVQEAEQSQTAAVQEAYYQQQKELFNANRSTEETILQLLKDYQLPVDTYHIMAARQLVHDRNSIFRKLFDPKNMQREPDLQQVKENLLKEFAEAVKTPEDMAKAQQTLAETAEHIMDTMINEEDISSLDVRELKVLRTEIELSSRMSREENYAVPVLIADEMTNVQLKIVRGKQKRGMVDILFDTARLGKVAARIQVSANKVEGFVISDQAETTARLQEQEEELAGRMQIEEGQKVRFDFVTQENVSLSGFSQTAFGASDTGAEADKEAEAYQVQTRQLYTIARAFLETAKQI